jgi:hypothetical protein
VLPCAIDAIDEAMLIGDPVQRAVLAGRERSDWQRDAGRPNRWQRRGAVLGHQVLDDRIRLRGGQDRLLSRAAVDVDLGNESLQKALRTVRALEIANGHVGAIRNRRKP